MHREPKMETCADTEVYSYTITTIQHELTRDAQNRNMYNKKHRKHIDTKTYTPANLRNTTGIQIDISLELQYS